VYGEYIVGQWEKIEQACMNGVWGFGWTVLLLGLRLTVLTILRRTPYCPMEIPCIETRWIGQCKSHLKRTAGLQGRVQKLKFIRGVMTKYVTGLLKDVSGHISIAIIISP